MLLLLLVGGTAVTFAVPSLAQLLPYLSDGVTIQGAVVNKREEAPGGHRARRYLIQYQFVDAAGNRHQREDRAAFAEWSAVKPGDAIAIRHIRNEPARSRPERIIWQDFRELFMLAILGLGITAGAVCAGVMGVSRVNTRVRRDFPLTPSPDAASLSGATHDRSPGNAKGQAYADRQQHANEQ
jgi:hypothetical protein